MILNQLNWARFLLVLSGAAALGWQFIWTTQWTLLLGHEIYAVLAVSASFLGGLCLGTWLMGTGKTDSLGHYRIYFYAELMIAIWSQIVVHASPSLGPIVSTTLGETPSPTYHALMAFALPFFTLIPSTVAMGLTLPAMMGMLPTKPENMPNLYASNTFGACLGVIVIVFYLLAEEGIKQSSWILSSVNVFCAVAAAMIWRQQVNQKFNEVRESHFKGGMTLFSLGFLGMGYQVFSIRILSLVTENTVYSYALLLIVYLAFHALGASLFNRFKTRDAQANREDFLLSFLIVSIFLGSIGLTVSNNLCSWPSETWGRSPANALAGEFLAAIAGLAIPSISMGMVFTHQTMQNDNSKGWLGKSLFLNLLGSSLAPLIIGLWIYPQWGAEVTLILLLIGYTALQTFKKASDFYKIWPLNLCLLVLSGHFSWDFLDIPEGGKKLFHERGVMASVSVIEDIDEIARLKINNRVQEGSSASSWVERRLAVLPLMLHSDPREVLMLGLGTGFTSNAAAEFSHDLKVETVELLPEIIQASDVFIHYPNMPKPIQPVLKVAADARRFVNGSTKKFDVIVADIYHPARSGASTLYTTEHFQKIKNHLNKGGVFCQWLALFQMDTNTLRSIIAAYQSVYPDAKAVLVSNSLDSPAIGLISKKDAPWPLISEIKKKWENPEMVFSAKQAHIEDAFEIWGSVFADASALHEFTAGFEPNTDDDLQVGFKAPWVTYAPQESPRARLGEVLSLWHVEPDINESEDMQKVLKSYSQAHKLYLQMGFRIKPNSDPYMALILLKEDLFNLIKINPTFHPAYETLTTLAIAVSPQHPELSQSVISQLNLIKSRNNQSIAH